MCHLARVLTRVYFRRIEVAGAEPLPGGPVVLVANHVNGLVDGMVLLTSLDRYPRFLGKSTLFKILPLAPFLRLAGVVPVYRASDGGTERNREAFATAGAILSSGAMVAVFPEGVSHDDAHLHPLRTGAARIALAAVDQGVTGLAVVPVGLIYEEKARFRSRALVRLGGGGGGGGGARPGRRGRGRGGGALFIIK
jgi:glycerol-3-phosphate O-acyltransferase/dihydroxyacetone phosphate acyltransferase